MTESVKTVLKYTAGFFVGFLFGFLFFAVHFDSFEEVDTLQLQLEQCQRDVASCGDDPQLCQAIMRRYK